jgi:hypothetical protein
MTIFLGSVNASYLSSAQANHLPLQRPVIRPPDFFYEGDQKEEKVAETMSLIVMTQFILSDPGSSDWMDF